MRKRVKLEVEQKCVWCGDILPAGMTAYSLSGSDGTGYLHYGQCKGMLSGKIKRNADLSKITLSELLKVVRGELLASETVRDMAMQEILRREKAFREKVQEALEEIESDERLGYPTATVVENAPLALIQCGLGAQVRALKYVLMVLDVKDGKK